MSDLLFFSNFEVSFLFPNLTSHIQFLGTGIIAKVKAKSKHWVLIFVFENIDCEEKSIYNIDVSTEMCWICLE